MTDTQVDPVALEGSSSTWGTPQGIVSTGFFSAPIVLMVSSGSCRVHGNPQREQGFPCKQDGKNYFRRMNRNAFW
ncbi:hypothetical protein CA85_01770 [Allorhodopirellula solitaria]|uniref:Uncharacterized protein n=1 Tax=Allorhodopirellula solitaria TaxID=2527987 RepID=A0A5C5YJ47_9BACT|nr:hypothetical protein CA85_01770 [Allorhodopirellula solitaria]